MTTDKFTEWLNSLPLSYRIFEPYLYLAWEAALLSRKIEDSDFVLQSQWGGLSEKFQDFLYTRGYDYFISLNSSLYSLFAEQNFDQVTVKATVTPNNCIGTSSYIAIKDGVLHDLRGKGEETPLREIIKLILTKYFLKEKKVSGGDLTLDLNCVDNKVEANLVLTLKVIKTEVVELL